MDWSTSRRYDVTYLTTWSSDGACGGPTKTRRVRRSSPSHRRPPCELMAPQKVANHEEQYLRMKGANARGGAIPPVEIFVAAAVALCQLRGRAFGVRDGRLCGASAGRKYKKGKRAGKDRAHSPADAPYSGEVLRVTSLPRILSQPCYG